MGADQPAIPLAADAVEGEGAGESDIAPSADFQDMVDGAGGIWEGDAAVEDAEHDRGVRCDDFYTYL